MRDMSSKFNEVFFSMLNKPENSKIKERIESPAFKVSQEILGKRIDLKLSQEDAANKVGISLDEYRKFEHATNVGASLDKYKEVLGKLSASSKPAWGYSVVKSIIVNSDGLVYPFDGSLIDELQAVRNKKSSENSAEEKYVFNMN